MSNAKDDCNELLGAVMPLAVEMLTRHREFYPFGGTMAADGEIAHTSGWTGDESPPSAELIALLQSAFQAGAKSGAYQATALVSDVLTIPPGKEAKQDAIAVALDHRDNYSIVVVFPYSFAADGELVMEEPFAAKGEGKVFPQ